MDRASKLRKIEHLRRKLPHASASFFSALLKAVKADPSLAEGPSNRVDLKNARDAVVLHDRTAFGPMLTALKLAKDSGEFMDIYVAHPFAVLEYSLNNAENFKEFFMSRLHTKPCTVEKPWHIILYSDEVTPGNVHAPLNKRKFQAVYWSFLEFGSAALSHEEFWFPILTEYSYNVKQLSGGMSQVFVALCKLFFEPNGFNIHPSKGGINLGPIVARFFAVMGVILQDGGAHKSVWHARDGSKMCMICKNLFTIESEVANEDGSGLLACGIIKLNELVAETSVDLRNKARFLEYHRADRDFEQLQQSLGVTYHPLMFLLDRYLDDYVDVVDVFFTDWMHALFVDGVFCAMLYLLFEAFFAGRRPIYNTFLEFLQSWCWPAKFKKTAEELGEIFGPERTKSSRKAKHIKCSASECWCLLMPLYVFVKQVLLRFDDHNAECNVFLAMIDMIDLIVSTPKRRIEPANLLAAVHKFLELFVAVWGFEWTTPKYHWLLHFAEFLAKMHEIMDDDDDWGWLPNCFALERKHKLGKRYATERTNTTRMKSGGLLSEVLCQHMSDMDNAPRFRIGLVQGHKATKAVQTQIRSSLELSDDILVEVARSSWHSNLSYSTKGDFVLFRNHADGTMKAGKVQLHFEAGGVPASIVELYELVSRHDNYLVWKLVADTREWIETDLILDCVVYNKLPDGNIACMLPVELR